ncbi:MULTISPECIES: hypothetical protein [unclassified Clostridium]|uniref:hypothetical protein n=1 Tax=unclassified Clostridium TaxID=2614128 RepID=UPI0002982417|nr:MULTISPECIES: hypothetical protein [unclassified Clostridium]EKQ56321.1 MAG: hypothetical protein A370_02077 [Clostridium sp. Maddingley MBC34-26]
MVARCKCGLIWNISIKTEIPSEGYVCPKCRTKDKKMMQLRKGVIPNVLLRNRKKFQA